MMQAVEWGGKKKIVVNSKRPVPVITDPGDAIIKVTSTAICGSDLHMYLAAMPGMRKGDLLGHEFMGIVAAVGPDVKKFQPGDRVVVSCIIACGVCSYCKSGETSLCDTTNDSHDMKMLYGDDVSGVHGYGHLTGGYEGGQAEFARVLFADFNLMKVPATGDDEKYLYLTDILPTAWHGTELGEVGPGDIVAIWGLGPVGQLAAMCAWARGAKRVIAIDEVPARLEKVKELAPGTETINFRQADVRKTLKEVTDGRGPDVGIEAAGFHYVQGIMHKIETKLKLETDPPVIVNEMITSVRKGGRISLIGDYVGFSNHFNLGALMEKAITLRGGQNYNHKYRGMLLQMIEEGKLQPWKVTSHRLPLLEAAMGYEKFDAKEFNKVVLKTSAVAGDIA
jgi:threonine dehydrogenase-like Zn-dependent dehydrogenase